MPVTHDQAVMLAELAAAARPHGARRWDKPGIVAAIRKVSHLHLVDVALAVIRAADDPTLETPGAIGNTQTSCWRERPDARPAPLEHYNPRTFCGICSKPEHRCRANPHGDHDFEPATHTARNARANAQETSS